MSYRSHHRSRRRQSVLELLVGIFVLAALAAQPLHLMEGHGDVVPSLSMGFEAMGFEAMGVEAMGVEAMGVEAHPISGAGFDGESSLPEEKPFSNGDGTCLDCLALSLTAVTGAWVAVPVAYSPVLTASPPSPRPPMEFRGKADARPRAPPSA